CLPPTSRVAHPHGVGAGGARSHRTNFSHNLYALHPNELLPGLLVASRPGPLGRATQLLLLLRDRVLHAEEGPRFTAGRAFGSRFGGGSGNENQLLPFFARLGRLRDFSSHFVLMRLAGLDAE